MNELSVSPNLALLLDRYQSIGGVVEHIVLERNTAVAQQVTLHRLAALDTVSILGQRLDYYFERLLESDEFKHRQRKEFFRLQVQPELLHGYEISLPDFLGPHFDLNRRCLVLRGQRNEHLNDYFYAGEEENKQNALPVRTNMTEFTTSGYAQAFAEPPYPLRASHEEINSLFRAIIDELFCSLECPLQIYQWSTRWSNFFDAGHEWWGSFLWTVEPEGANHIVGIASSSTD